MLPTPKPTLPIDTARCPLCGQANQCAMAQQPAPARCWCMDDAMADDALAAIPEADRGQRCICAACARGAASSAPDGAGQAL